MGDLISRQAVLTLFEERFLELQIAKRLPENKVQEYEQSGVNWCINTVRDIPSVENKAEIEKKCDRINSIASVLRYPQHREIQELLCEILASIDNAESEDKE